MMKQAEKGMNENTLFLVLLFAYAPLLYSQTAIFKICNECNWTMAAIDCWVKMAETRGVEQHI